MKEREIFAAAQALRQRAPSQFEEGYTFLGRGARDAKEVFAVGLGEPAVAFGQVGGNGKGGTIELVGASPEIVRVQPRSLSIGGCKAMRSRHLGVPVFLKPATTPRTKALTSRFHCLR